MSVQQQSFLIILEKAFIFYSSEINFLYVWSTELKGLGSDFVFGFVQSMDGERDPRNLLLAFQIAKNIIYRGYDLGKAFGNFKKKTFLICWNY